MIIADLIASVPELWLACAGMVLLMVGVFHRGDDPAHSLLDECLCTGRCLAVMRAGLQRDVSRRAAGCVPRSL